MPRARRLADFWARGQEQHGSMAETPKYDTREQQNWIGVQLEWREDMTLRTLKRYRLERLTQPTEQENRSMDHHALSLANVASFQPLSPGANVLREGPPTILAIDDSRTIQKIIEITLRRAGYEVCLFSNGLEALSWLRGDNRPVSRLMLLDIQLPKMDGYEVARMLRAKNLLEEMPLILMSSRDGVVDRLKGRLVGAQAYLTKPFTAQQLLEAVHQYLGGKMPMNPPPCGVISC